MSQLLLVAQLDTLPIELNEVLELNDATAEIAAGLAPYAISLSKSIELIRARIRYLFEPTPSHFERR